MPEFLESRLEMITAFLVFAVIGAGAFVTLFLADQKDIAAGLFGVFAGGLVTWLLSVNDERRRRSEEAKSIASGLYSEILYIARSALIARNVWRKQALLTHELVGLDRVRKFIPSPAPLFNGMTEKITLFPADVVGKTTAFYSALDIIRRVIASFDTEGTSKTFDYKFASQFANREHKVCIAASAALNALTSSFPHLADYREQLLVAYSYDEPAPLEQALLDKEYQPKPGSF